MMGVAYFNLERFDPARQQFRAARGYDQTKKQANSWLTYLENELRRREMSKQVLQRPSS